MNARSTSGLVIATSAGAPMRSTRPKPIHLLCGRPMAGFVLETIEAAGVGRTVVVTAADGGRVAKRLLQDSAGSTVRFVEQSAQLGANDAALVGVQSFDEVDSDDDDVLIVPADVPLLRPSTARLLLDAHRSTGAACTVLSADAESPSMRPDPSWQPTDRIVRDRYGRVASIDTDNSRLLVEDALAEEPEEYSLGVFCVRRGLLAPALRRAAADRSRDGSQPGVTHLSGIVEVLAGSGHLCETVLIDHPADLIPVNDRIQLAEAEAELRRRTNQHWMSTGVTMVDPSRTYIDVTVRLGIDVTIFPGTILQGSTTIGDGTELGPDARLDRCTVGSNCKVEKVTATLAQIGDDSVVGPFAVLGPGSVIEAGSHAGPFYDDGVRS